MSALIVWEIDRSWRKSDISSEDTTQCNGDVFNWRSSKERWKLWVDYGSRYTITNRRYAESCNFIGLFPITPLVWSPSFLLFRRNNGIINKVFINVSLTKIYVIWTAAIWHITSVLLIGLECTGNYKLHGFWRHFGWEQYIAEITVNVYGVLANLQNPWVVLKFVRFWVWICLITGVITKLGSIQT